MRMGNRIKMAIAALSGAAVLVAPAAGAATAAPVSSIRSPAQQTCLDVSTTSGLFADTYGHACDGAASQAFAFHALSTGPANTYEITSRSSGQCLDQYRSGIRQEACTGSVPPDPANVEWTLEQVGTTGHRYNFVVTDTVGTPSPRCVTVSPRPNGYPGPLFDLAACNGDPSQVLALTVAP